MAGEGPLILAVDDDPNTLDMLASILGHEGFSVATASTGDEGLRTAQTISPDLIILDIDMPGKDGLEVMRELRADPATGDTPILFLSAVDDEATVVQGLKGADDYMLKPLKALELETRIRKILKRSETERAGRAGTAVVDDRLPVRLDKETYLFPLNKIYFAEAYGKYSYVSTRERRYLTDYSISDLEGRLSADRYFMRVHRSFIVNFEHVHKLTRDERGRTVLVMADSLKTSIRVSDGYLETVRARLGL